MNKTRTFTYFNVDQEQRSIEINPNALAFTFCQVPIVYAIAEQEGVAVHYKNGSVDNQDELVLSKEITDKIFMRTAEVDHLKVNIIKTNLK